MPELRTRAKLVRLTPAEFNELERRARAAGRRPAHYLREAALSETAPAPAPGRAAADLIHVLTRIGADLRIVGQSPRSDAISSKAEAVLSELLTTLRQLTASYTSR
jgi:hypothetical protein